MESDQDCELLHLSHLRNEEEQSEGGREGGRGRGEGGRVKIVEGII